MSNNRRLFLHSRYSKIAQRYLNALIGLIVFNVVAPLAQFYFNSPFWVLFVTQMLVIGGCLIQNKLYWKHVRRWEAFVNRDCRRFGLEVVE